MSEPSIVRLGCGRRRVSASRARSVSLGTERGAVAGRTSYPAAASGAVDGTTRVAAPAASASAARPTRHGAGLWLFYIQHQFDDVAWDRGEVWDYKTAALTGCSFLKLPRVLQWFTGNIGYHHVHHLSSRIPNYKLEACHNENEMFKNVKPIKLMSTFRALFLSLWDEKQQKLISFKRLKEMRMSSELSIAG
jgi:fatty acid desaturase